MSFPETQIKGSILVGSSVAGAASMTPLPVGPDGQVLTADSTQPTGLKWAPAGAGSDIYAATRVVSLIAGDGTDLTIAAAILALPAEGGLIYVKQGTYPLAASIALPAGKPVTIRGSGSGTIISLGANAIPAFTIPTGYTANTPIVLDNFLVTGTEVAGQTVVQYGDNNGLAEVYMENIVTTGVELTIDSASTSSASSAPGQDDPRFHLLRCRIRPCSTNNSVILHNSSFGLPRAWLTEVEFIGDSLFAIPALRTAPLFGRLADDTWFGDCYLDTCEMSIGTGESDFATFECFNSTLWNNDDVNLTVTYFLFGSFEGLNPGTVRDSSCRGIYFEAEEAGSNFFSNWLQDCPIGIFGAGVVVGDNQLIEVRNPWPVAHPFGIQIQNEQAVIRNNRFRFRQTTPPQIIDVEVSTRILGNDFSECFPPVNGTILLNSGENIITDNYFTFAPTTGPNVNETGGGGASYYDNNNRLFTNKTGGGPIVDPILPRGNGSTIQGTTGVAGSASVGGTATNSLIVWYRNPYGLAMVKGYIQNNGVNNITVQETFRLDTLGTFTKSTVVVPGAKLTLDPYDFAGTAIPAGSFQVYDYRVDVSGTTIAWYTFFPMPGGVLGT
jgi:hypothetical protein